MSWLLFSYFQQTVIIYSVDSTGQVLIVMICKTQYLIVKIKEIFENYGAARFSAGPGGVGRGEHPW